MPDVFSDVSQCQSALFALRKSQRFLQFDLVYQDPPSLKL